MRIQMSAIVLLMPALFLIAGCAGMAYKKADEANSIGTYRQFVSKYPDSEYTPQAKKRIEELYWQQKMKQNTISGYETYIKEYPGGKYEKEAKIKIEDMIWDSAETIQSYEEYLKKYPEGKYAKEAEVKIENKAFMDAKNSCTTEALMSFVEKYADSEHVSEANDLLKRLRLLKGELNSESRYADVKVGMSESALVKMLGKPDSTSMIITQNGLSGFNAYWYIDSDKDPLYCKYIYAKVNMNHEVVQVVLDVGMKN